jgi:hypothetical protein
MKDSVARRLDYIIFFKNNLGDARRRTVSRREDAKWESWITLIIIETWGLMVSIIMTKRSSSSHSHMGIDPPATHPRHDARARSLPSPTAHTRPVPPTTVPRARRGRVSPADTAARVGSRVASNGKQGIASATYYYSTAARDDGARGAPARRGVAERRGSGGDCDWLAMCPPRPRES